MQNAASVVQNSPLVYRDIINAVFANPHRRKHPSFYAMRGWTGYPISNESHSAEFFYGLPSPESIQTFNSTGISLKNSSYLVNKFGGNSDLANQVLSALSSCSWCGPYYAASTGCFSFASINDSGSNEYCVYMDINMG